MPTVKLGYEAFDVDGEQITARYCGVSDAVCVAFAARMRTGEISRVKTLDLVSFFLWCCVLALNSRWRFRRRA